MDIKQIFRVLLPHTVCNQICMAFIPGLASLWTNNEIFGTTYKHAWGKFYFRFLHYLIFSNLNLSSESEFRLSPFCPRCFACTVNCGSATRYHQISAIFQAFLLNFSLFFTLLFSPGGSPVSIKWLSTVLYGNFSFFLIVLSYKE